MIELRVRKVALATGVAFMLSVAVAVGINQNYGAYLFAAYIESVVFMVLLFGLPKKKGDRE